MPLPVSPTPYITPSTLISAPTGISWSTIPPGRDTTPAQKYAEQLNICQRATQMADQYCNQVLRATTDTEMYTGPGDYGGRVNLQQDTGLTRVILQRWPILTISSIQVAASSVFPRQWQTLPSNWWSLENPVSGLYGSVVPVAAGQGGQAMDIGPGYISWCLGRQGFTIQIQYVNGWPHAGLTASASVGATAIAVDDCTGWTVPQADTGLVGATGVIYDGGQQEVVQVTGSSTTSGPGTLTLATGLLYDHESGVAVTTLPETIRWACILFGAAMALTRGATSTTVQAIPGTDGSSTRRSEDLNTEGELLLHAYRRTIL
jgi:hypothetical protein